DPDRARAFRVRVFDENGLDGSVTLTQGLVGKRSGAGVFSAALAGVSSSEPGVSMSYAGLSSVLGPGRVALLKCDIEGSEQDLLENYPEILRRTDVVVFELHSELVDVERCMALLREYGFLHTRMERADSPYRLCTAWR